MEAERAVYWAGRAAKDGRLEARMTRSCPSTYEGRRSVWAKACRINPAGGDSSAMRICTIQSTKEREQTLLAS